MAIFSLSGKIPDGKERLKSTDRLLAIQSFANFIIFIGMLLGPIMCSVTTKIRYYVYDFSTCAWFIENRLIAWVFQEMIKRFLS